MAGSENYDYYWPTKMEEGKRHPNLALEKVFLASVEPPEIYYQLSIPLDVIDNGKLSALQLESITYAAQTHNYRLPDGTRAGFLMGDGPGVGKSRIIAGMIYENFLNGRQKAIWIYVSRERREDIFDDFIEIGATRIYFRALKDLNYNDISSQVFHEEGVVFSSYSTLIGESHDKKAKYRTRMSQLLQWCGKKFKGLIIFDECHKAKDLCPAGSGNLTKIGQTVLELQQKLPKARVVYVSSTGVSEPRKMACMVRLGLWGQGTAFGCFNDFVTAMERCGAGAMELVAMDMKLRGTYLARQLSFKDTNFRIKEVTMSKEFRKIYDQSVELWVEAREKFSEAAELIDVESRMKKIMWEKFWSSHQRFFKYLSFAAKSNRAILAARESVKHGKCVVIGLHPTGEARTVDQLLRNNDELTDFVSSAKGVIQSFVERHFPTPDKNRINRLVSLFDPPSSPLEGSSNGNNNNNSAAAASKRKGLGISNGKAKKLKSEDKADDEDKENNDNEDKENNDNENNENNARSTMVTEEKIKKKVIKEEETEAAAAPSTSSTETRKALISTSIDAIVRACTMKGELLVKIERLGPRLPPNSLDRLIEELGGPKAVAEMTGRRGRFIKNDDGSYKHERRCEMDLMEKDSFIHGSKDVVIILEAVSCGISIQCDRWDFQKRRRVHIMVDMPSSPEQALLHFGRTHRTSQFLFPEYIFLVSELGGERHFASTLAMRLESLGGRNQGGRRSIDTSDLSKFNIDNKYGRQALETVMRTIMDNGTPLVPPPTDYSGEFFKDIADALVGVGLIVKSKGQPGALSLDTDYNNISKFLDRILGCPVDLQICLFKYFTDTMTAIIEQAKRVGRFGLEIPDLGAAGRIVSRVGRIRFLQRHPSGRLTKDLHTVRVARAMIWQEALDKYADLDNESEGFYLSHNVRNNKRAAIMVVILPSTTNSDSNTAGNSDNSNKKKATPTKKEIMCQIYRPNTGLQVRHESLFELEKKYRKVQMTEAEPHWKQQYDASENTCSHVYWSGNCQTVSLGTDCELGLRHRVYHVLAGTVLSVWGRVEHILSTRSKCKMQVVRMNTTDEELIMGILIPKSCVETLIQFLRSDSAAMEEFLY